MPNGFSHYIIAGYTENGRAHAEHATRYQCGSHVSTALITEVAHLPIGICGWKLVHLKDQIEDGIGNTDNVILLFTHKHASPRAIMGSSQDTENQSTLPKTNGIYRTPRPIALHLHAVFVRFQGSR